MAFLSSASLTPDSSLNTSSLFIDNKIIAIIITTIAIICGIPTSCFNNTIQSIVVIAHDEFCNGDKIETFTKVIALYVQNIDTIYINAIFNTLRLYYQYV